MVALAQRMRVSIDEPDDNEVQFLSLVVTARAYDATLAATERYRPVPNEGVPPARKLQNEKRGQDK